MAKKQRAETPPPSELSRRELLKGAGAAAVGAVFVIGCGSSTPGVNDDGAVDDGQLVFGDGQPSCGSGGFGACGFGEGPFSG